MEYRIPPGTEAVEKLEDFIVVNRLAPNTRIPSERDLCEMWGSKQNDTETGGRYTCWSWGVI